MSARHLLLFRRPALTFDFTGLALPPGATLARASTGWYFDGAGVLQSASDDVPRLTHDPATLARQGVLVEPARTNSITNSTAAGAVAGTPGTNPTGWSISGVTSNVTKEIVGTGTEDGISYLDIRYYGTPSANNSVFVTPSGVFSTIAATVGQTWACSSFIRLVGGSLANLNALRLILTERNGAGTTVANGLLDLTPTSAALRTQRIQTTRTLTVATTAYLSVGFGIGFTNGLAIDITLRIGIPSAEQGSGASSPIKTSSAAVTRAADVVSISMASGLHDIAATCASGVTLLPGVAVNDNSYIVPTDLSPLQWIEARRIG